MRQHIRHFVLGNTARVVQVHVAAVIFVDGRLPALRLVGMITVGRVVHVISQIVVTCEVLF